MWRRPIYHRQVPSDILHCITFPQRNFSLLKTNWLTLLSRLLIGTRGLVGGRDRLDVYITYCYCT